MKGYFIKASDIVARYFENEDISIPNNLNKFIDLVISAEKKIGTGSTKVPYKRYFRKGIDVELTDTKLAIPSNVNAINLVSTENGSPISYFVKGRYLIFNNPGPKDCVAVTYDGLMLDEESGFPLVSANHEDVLFMALELYFIREGYKEGKVPRYVYVDIKTEFEDSVLDVRAQDMSPDAVTEAELYVINQSLIPPVFVDTETNNEDGGIIIIDKSKE